MIFLSLLSKLTTFIFSFIEIILSLRILLKLFGANSIAPFVSWIYITSKPLLHPFEGMFPAESVGSGFVIEISTLFAVFVYALLGAVAEELIWHLAEFKKKREIKD